MKDQVDTQLRDQQAGFRKDRSCMDQIATLRIIVEQSLEWNNSLYSTFSKIINIIRNSYNCMTYRVVHEGKLTETFEVYYNSTYKNRNPNWTPFTQLEDLDFVDDLALLSHTRQQMQEKTNSTAATSAQVGLNINKQKTKILKVNNTNNDPVQVDGEALEEVKAFIYLGSVIEKQGRTDTDVKARICKARAAFLKLRNIWSSKELGLRTKVWYRDMEDNSGNSEESTDLHQLLSAKNHPDPLAKHDQHPGSLAENQSASCRR
ncbi:hypothetical protein F2P79_000061 [Pimephales promelas]|nr:hypothetical protein F2P79_000061 [Pimephales promelas]